MSKFTKGPWQAKDFEVESSGRMVADCGISNYKNSEEEERANAHLIAAAPDMYKLLKSIESDPSQTNVITIRNTLKKSRGE